MKSSRRKCLSRIAGYSLVEMMMTLAVGLVLVSVALPAMVSAIQGYRLNSAAQQIANFIDLTRYTAIRNNKVTSLQSAVQNGTTILYIDLNGDGQMEANEPRVMLPSDIVIANGDSLIPSRASTSLPNLQDFSNQITFDSRGVLNFGPGGIAPAPYFLALGFTTRVDSGYRAITVTPMGQTKMWRGPANGAWSAI
jgi:prepilin-type N-terminal cleavage/methylation domain-containing protein